MTTNVFVNVTISNTFKWSWWRSVRHSRGKWTEKPLFSHGCWVSKNMPQTSSAKLVGSTNWRAPEGKPSHTFFFFLTEHLNGHLKQHSPKVDIVDVPLPEADGGISSSGQHVTLWALGIRWELETQDIHRSRSRITPTKLYLNQDMPSIRRVKYQHFPLLLSPSGKHPDLQPTCKSNLISVSRDGMKVTMTDRYTGPEYPFTVLRPVVYI